jgi:hypothetical protein
MPCPPTNLSEFQRGHFRLLRGHFREGEGEGVGHEIGLRRSQYPTQEEFLRLMLSRRVVVTQGCCQGGLLLLGLLSSGVAIS